jgi:hypothetical protein
MTMAQVLENIGAGEGTRTLAFSREVDELCNAFNGHSDFLQLCEWLRPQQNFLLSE